MDKKDFLIGLRDLLRKYDIYLTGTASRVTGPFYNEPSVSIESANGSEIMSSCIIDPETIHTELARLESVKTRLACLRISNELTASFDKPKTVTGRTFR